MRLFLPPTFLFITLLFAFNNMNAGTSPCNATNYQLSDFGITKTYTLDNGTFTELPDPSCGDYQGQDFWVEFMGPSSGSVNIELLDGSITDAAFEVYWNACSGLATSVGCFSNRNCGAIPMPGANLSVIPGETYHVRIYQEGGGGGTLGFRMSDLGGTNFNLGGSAEVYNSGVPNQNCVQLTTENNNQVGCAWFDTPIDFSSGFEINYQLYFGTIDAGGADGIAFVFHTDPTPPCSNAGGQLGVVGIQNSFIVEFDTWFNGNFGDIPDDHVAINIDGAISIPVAPPVSIGVNGNVEDGMFHAVSLQWDPITNLFKVFFDGDLMISTDVGILTNIFVAGTPVYWGLTGTTGGAFNDQIFCFDGFSVENTNAVENNIEAFICEGSAYPFGNDFLFDADTYVQSFPAANGCDSTVTLTLGIVEIDITGIDEVELPCVENAPVVQLAAEVTSNVEESQLTYNWDTPDGGFDSGKNTLTPIINSAGTYTLTVNYPELNCDEEFIVEVTTATPPDVFVNDGFIGCSTDSTVVLDCEHDENLDIVWFDEDGNIIDNGSSTNPVVDSIGIYTVTVTDPITGCSNSASLSIGSGGSGASGPDIRYCVNEQNEIYLAGEIFGDVVSYQWEPAAGLSDPNILNPRVLDPSFAQEFTLCVFRRAGFNLVPNGNFAQGDTGFTSDYITGMSTPGEYMITNDPTTFFSLFPDCDDNSENDDQMMIVDGATSSNQNIWCQQLEVNQGGTYIFSAHAANLCGDCFDNYPLLSLTANGTAINIPEPLDSDDCDWQIIESDPWVASDMIVEFCITNNELEPIGNDFAIDDIELFFVCKGGDGEPCIVAPYSPLGVDIAPVEIACQPDGIVVLNAIPEGDVNASIAWSWEVVDQNGIYLSDPDSPNPTVQGPGTYFVTIINNDTGCSAVDSIVLEMGDPAYPEYILAAEPISCENPTSLIVANDLDAGGNYSLFWSGSSFSGGGEYSIEALVPGEYFVTVTDLENNCETEQSIIVVGDTELPEATLLSQTILNCFIPDADLAVDFPAGSDYSFSWSSSNGNFITSLEMPQVTVSQGGNYSVLVTDNETGCENPLEIIVEEDFQVPSIVENTPTVLDCNNNQTEVSVFGGSVDYSYEWTPNANIITGLNNDNIIVTDAGNYEVIITDISNGCETATSIQVISDFTEPEVEAGPSQTFGCNDMTLDLSGSSNSDISFIEWQSAGGVIISGGNTLSPSIGGAGTYFVTVTGENGCISSDSVSIEADIDLPTIAAPASLTLDCNATSIEIDATGSSSGADFTFNWQDENGNPITEFTTLNPSVSEPGIYRLTITNNSNGCDAQTEITVTEDYLVPSANTILPVEITCLQPSTTFGLETSNPDWTYIWSNSDGEILNENAFQLDTDAADDYNLLVIDQQNGCQSEFDFTVEDLVESPSISISGDNVLSCLDTDLSLQADSDAQSPTYNWDSSTNGNITSSTDLSQIQLNEPGVYFVTVTDGISGCTETSEFEVSQDQNNPIIEIATPEQITCSVKEVMLLATTSNIGSDVTYSWQTVNGILNSPNGAANIAVGSAGEYTLTVTNNENGCEESEIISVEESISTILVEIDTPGILDCETSEITLSAMEVVGNNIQYIWTTPDGNILRGEDGLTPDVNLPGLYTLTVTDLDNDCVEEASISVAQNGDQPVIVVADPGQLNCSNQMLTLDANGSSEGLDFLIEWSSSDGNIVNGENTLNPSVDADGTYLLTITNVQNNCQNLLEVLVEENTQSPVIVVQPIQSIDCDLALVEVNTEIQSANLDLQFEWTTSTGTIIGADNTQNIEAGAVGEYILTVTDLVNGCSDIFTATVVGNEDVPQVSINEPESIDCQTESSLISLNLPADISDLIFEWDTQNGSFDGDNTNPELLVSAAGNYQVTVTNIASNCEVILTTLVENNAATPSLSFLNPDTINCLNPKSVINTQTDQNGLIYNWTTVDGTITSEANGEDVVVSSAGIYSLTVIDPANNCENKIEVEVIEDIDLPFINIQPALELNCIIEEQSLSADGSSQGAEFSYTWSSQFGNIVSGANSLNPLIGAPGYYLLEVVNTENNCVQKDSILIQENTIQPLADIAAPNVLNCNNETVNISSDVEPSSSLTLTWTSLSGNIISDPNQAIIEVDLPGVYELSILDNTNGCENNLSTIVEANIAAPVLEVSPGFTLNCNDEDGMLAIEETDPSAQIEWFDPQNESLSVLNAITVSEPGLYSVVATLPINGCVTTRTIEVLKNDNVPTELMAEIDPPLCAGDVGSIIMQEVIGGEGPYLYSTDGGQTFNALSLLDNLAPGSSNSIVVLDNNGCQLVTEFFIPTVQEVDINLPLQVELDLGENYQIQAITNIPVSDIEQIIWTPSVGLSCADCLNPTVTPGTDIIYQVEIFNLNGCSEIAEIQFRVDQEINVYIPNAFTPFNLDGINDKFYIFSKENLIAKVQSLQVFDRWGNEVFINKDFAPNDPSEGWDGFYRKEKMQAGVYVYYVVIEFSDGSTELFKGDLTLMN